MATLLALSAMCLTSWLPISTKFLVRDARPPVVAWCINAASLPLLAGGTLLLLHGRVPRGDGIFVMALLVSAAMNWGATLLATHALAQADASLVSPLLTFNPAFTLIVAWPVLGERPGLREAFGVVLILGGAYLLDRPKGVRDGRAPLHAFLQRP